MSSSSKKPGGLKTRIFLDGGDFEETRQVIELLGFLDGQTTNPTLISKNRDVRFRLERGIKFTDKEILDFYYRIVSEASRLVPKGSVSIEVYADVSTSAEAMIAQARKMFSWIPNAHIKFPVTAAGLQAAEWAIKEGLRVNMTLCFTQEQAAAVYAAAGKAKKGQVFVSPFVGRLDDRGENGMDLIKNIIRMYGRGDGRVEVLTASVRNLDHFLYAIKLGSDIVTSPKGVLEEWAGAGMPVPSPDLPESNSGGRAGNDFQYEAAGLAAIPYQEISLKRNWRDYNIFHELTDRGVARFADDWNKLVDKNLTDRRI